MLSCNSLAQAANCVNRCLPTSGRAGYCSASVSGPAHPTSAPPTCASKLEARILFSFSAGPTPRDLHLLVAVRVDSVGLFGQVAPAPVVRVPVPEATAIAPDRPVLSTLPLPGRTFHGLACAALFVQECAECLAHSLRHTAPRRGRFPAYGPASPRRLCNLLDAGRTAAANLGTLARMLGCIGGAYSLSFRSAILMKLLSPPLLISYMRLPAL